LLAVLEALSASSLPPKPSPSFFFFFFFRLEGISFTFFTSPFSSTNREVGYRPRPDVDGRRVFFFFFFRLYFILLFFFELYTFFSFFPFFSSGSLSLGDRPYNHTSWMVFFTAGAITFSLLPLVVLKDSGLRISIDSLPPSSPSES